jgi:hypothetical protein
VVEHSTPNPKIKGLIHATGKWREREKEREREREIGLHPPLDDVTSP